MPLVHIRHTAAVPRQVLRKLTPVVCDTVAHLLTHTNESGDFAITPRMVKVRFDKASPLDTNTPDLYIDVEARAFPVRLDQVEQYAAAVCQAVRPLVPAELQVSVWFKLCHAGWHSQPPQQA
jgi:hypothetical protein